MKRILLILSLTSCALLPAQCTDTAKGWELTKGSTYFQHIYTSQYDSTTLTQLLIQQLRTDSKTSSVSLLNGGIIAEVRQYLVRTDKHQSNFVFKHVAISYPLDYNISIDIKNYQYRITISKLINNLYTTQGRMTYDWSTRLYNRKGCVRLKGGKAFDAIRIVGYCMTDLYQLKESVKGW